MIKSKNTYLNEVLNKLESYSKRKFLLKIIDRFLKAVVASILLFTFFVTLESLFEFNSDVRSVLFFFFLFSVLTLFSATIIPFVVKYFRTLTNSDYYTLSKEIGNHYSEIKDELINSLQLLNSDNKGISYSDELINSAFQQTYNKIKGIKFVETLSFNSQKKFARIAAGVVIVCFSFINFSPGINAASHRLLNYGTDFIPPPIFTFQIEPGNKQITKGKDVEIRITVKGEKLKEISLVTKTPEQTGYQFTPLKIDSLNQAKYKIKAVRNSFKYYASAKNINSSKYEIKVISRPLVKNLILKISPPPYSKQPVTIQKDNGNITALKGSKIKTEIASTKEIKNVYLEFDNQKNINLIPKAKKAVGYFTIKENGKYKIILIDTSGYKNQSPINYEINTLIDEYPEIELISPQADVSLSIDNRVPLLLNISDDFGFSSLKINYKLNSITSPTDQDKINSINIPIKKNSINEDVNYIWNLSDLNLTANDVLSFYVEIFDNDVVSGPKSAKTKTINVRIPSLDELLTKTDNTYNKSVDEFKETLKKA